jgi:hypothetical protein
MSLAKASTTLGAMSLIASHTFAQSHLPPSAVAMPPPEPETLAAWHLTCSDFKQNRDGSWSPLHPMLVSSTPMGPGTSLWEGKAVGPGIDLAAILNKECKRPPGDV